MQIYQKTIIKKLEKITGFKVGEYYTTNMNDGGIKFVVYLFDYNYENPYATAQIYKYEQSYIINYIRFTREFQMNFTDNKIWYSE